MILRLSVCLSHHVTAAPTCDGFAAKRRAYTTSGAAALVTARHSAANASSVAFTVDLGYEAEVRLVSAGSSLITAFLSRGGGRKLVT